MCCMPPVAVSTDVNITPSGANRLLAQRVSFGYRPKFVRCVGRWRDQMYYTCICGNMRANLCVYTYMCVRWLLMHYITSIVSVRENLIAATNANPLRAFSPEVPVTMLTLVAQFRFRALFSALVH